MLVLFCYCYCCCSVIKDESNDIIKYLYYDDDDDDDAGDDDYAAAAAAAAAAVNLHSRYLRYHPDPLPLSKPLSRHLATSLQVPSLSLF